MDVQTLRLRPYQEEAVEAIRQAWADGTLNVLLTAATGSGKTIVFLELARREISDNPDARVVILAHRKELIDQPIDRMHQFYLDLAWRAGVVMADRDDAAAQIIVATVQTLCSEQRLERVLSYGPITHLVVDECFPSGTLVDGVPIEKVQVGDCILGGVVTAVMERPSPDRLITVRAGARTVTCTENHPFWTRRGWVAAGELEENDHVAVTGCQERRVFAWARVDGVEVRERGGDGEFGGLCPGGHVYNLEVSPAHMYVANGFLVHNCHHVVASSYRKVLEGLQSANPSLRHVGVTATPIRSDGEGLAQVYDREVAHYGIKEMVGGGWLVPPRWLAIQTGISLAQVAVSNGDFVGKQLADVFETANCFELVVESHKKYADGRQCLAFVQTVDGAYRLAETFREAGIVAEAADGTTPKDERAAILRRFRSGKTQVLCNVALYSEGLDVPQVSCIHQVRPTKSDGLYLQMIGRGLRPVPGKDDALILDYAPLESRNIVMMGDVLGSPIRKELTVRDNAEPGEVVGGFTFDGKFNWLMGDVNEIISRKLDYLEMSPWSWHREGGWLSLGLGSASDGVERTMVVSPADDDGVCTLYGVFKRETDRYLSYRVLMRGYWEEIADHTEGLIAKYADPILASREKRWRRQPVTEAQLRFERWYGVQLSGLNRGEASKVITHARAMRVLQREGLA